MVILVEIHNRDFHKLSTIQKIANFVLALPLKINQSNEVCKLEM